MNTEEQEMEAAIDEATMIDDPKESLPESPASANIKFWIHGYGVMYTIRDTNSTLLLKRIAQVVEYAESHQWATSWEKTATSQPMTPQRQSSVSTEPVKYVCSIHGTPMQHKVGEGAKGHYDFYACGSKENGVFCKGKPVSPSNFV